MTTVTIDLNIRLGPAGQRRTFAGFEDADGPLAVGDTVRVLECESGVWGLADVESLDERQQLVYLQVSALHGPASG